MTSDAEPRINSKESAIKVAIPKFLWYPPKKNELRFCPLINADNKYDAGIESDSRNILFCRQSNFFVNKTEDNTNRKSMELEKRLTGSCANHPTERKSSGTKNTCIC